MRARLSRESPWNFSDGPVYPEKQLRVVITQSFIVVKPPAACDNDVSF